MLQSLGHDGLGCWEAETNFSVPHIEETCREPSKAELIQTVRAVQNVSFEMNKFACYIEEDTDPAFFLPPEPSDVFLGKLLFAMGKININSYVWHFRLAAACIK